MKSVFRINDLCPLSDGRTIHLITAYNDARLHLNDVLTDLAGNRFLVTGISDRNDPEDLSAGNRAVMVIFKELNGKEAQSSILLGGSAEISFLFCQHPFSPSQPDEDYESEYRNIHQDHPCALFSYEDMLEGKLKLSGDKISGLTIYRGWMMRPEMYERFYELLARQGIILINDPEEYSRYHLLPNWYDSFREETPASVWTEGDSVDEVLEAAKELSGPYIVKDYVKSRKHEWYDACFVPDAAYKNTLRTIVENFISRQGEDLVGGVVLRKYVKLKEAGHHPQSGMPLSEEYRIFLLGREIMAAGGYWSEDLKQLSEEELEWVRSVAERVRSDLVTLDLARKEDGKLIIMEFGDGQVSGLQQLPPERFYDLLRVAERRMQDALETGGCRCVFMYELDDAWGILQHRIAVFVDPEGGIIRTCFRDQDLSDRKLPEEEIRIGRDLILHIEEIIGKHEEIFSISEPEFNFVMDGVIGHFMFAEGDRASSFTAYNISYARSSYKQAYAEEPVNSWKLLDLFDEIAEVLTGMGIDKSFFSLDV